MKKKHIWTSSDFEPNSKMMNACISERPAVVDGLVSRWTKTRPGMRAMPVTMPPMALVSGGRRVGCCAYAGFRRRLLYRVIDLVSPGA